jgi:cation:H+ antiporter
MQMTHWFLSFPLFVNISIFALCAAAVWHVGSRLTLLADVISEQYQISRSTIGLLFLALATSLPEVATTLTAAIKSYQPLVLNNLFGGIVLQTTILAIADGFTKGALSNYPRKADHAREAVSLIALLSIVLMIALLQEPLVIMQVGLGSVIVMTTYIASIWLLRTSAGASNWVPVDLPDIKPDRYATPSISITELRREQLLYRALAYCGVILIVGIILVLCSAAISAQSGLGESFFGVTLLAAATSLPELTTTITAVRMGAFTLAISNIFGSNLIMLALILPADLLYRDGPILIFTDVNVLLALASGVLVSSVYVTGLLIRRKPRLGNFGLDSIVVIFIYILSVLLFYVSR